MQLDLAQFKTLFPDDQVLLHSVERFNYLQTADERPNIAVFGKFNHGKSTLLNALVGQEVFAASDKRETVVNKAFEDDKHQVIWLDTPGLDADVTGEDDLKANQGAFVSADIILLVHSLNVGELDRKEKEYFDRLLNDTSASVAKLLVISKIDQVPDDTQRNQALAKIQEQFPQFEIIETSAIRYKNGIVKNQPKLVELSGIPALSEKLQLLKANVAEARKSVQADIRQKLDTVLQAEITQAEQQIQAEKDRIATQRKAFKSNVDGYLSRVEKFGAGEKKEIASGSSFGGLVGSSVSGILSGVLDNKKEP